MNAYSSLSAKYDSLTGDVPYSKFIDLYESEFSENGGEFRLILDLCCGTGTLTAMMAEKGYEMIGVDASESMLMEAMQKSPGTLFICQDAVELDLYGTVDACISSLDSINYIPPSDFPEVLRRLHLFIRPEGLLIFDIRPEEWLRSMNGATSVDETDDTLCLWRSDYDETENFLCHGIDLFERQGKLWKRSCEEHIEYAYSLDFITDCLQTAHFSAPRVLQKKDRFFIITERK